MREFVFTARKTKGTGAHAREAGGEVANALAVHRRGDRVGVGNDPHPAFLSVRELRGRDRLDLGDDQVDINLGKNLAERPRVSHVEDAEVVRYLHGGGTGVGIARDDGGAIAFEGNGDFLAEFPRTQQEDAGGQRRRQRRCHDVSSLDDVCSLSWIWRARRAPTPLTCAIWSGVASLRRLTEPKCLSSAA